MTDVALYPHALGRTAGVDAFAENPRTGGHTVHVVDVHDGRTFGDLDAGLTHLREIGGPEEILRRAEAAVADLPGEFVHIGLSLGVLPSQVHAMDRDPFFVDDGDLEAARALPGTELFLYPGDTHLFAEAGTPWFDEGATTLMRTRVLAFLDRV